MMSSLNNNDTDYLYYEVSKLHIVDLALQINHWLHTIMIGFFDC